MKVEAGILRSLPLPQTHGVIVCARALRLKLGKSAEALDHLICLARRTVIGLGKKQITARIRRIQIRRVKQRLDGVVVVAARVEGDAQADRQPGGCG